MLKKTITIALTAILICSLAACSNNANTDTAAETTAMSARTAVPDSEVYSGEENSSTALPDNSNDNSSNSSKTESSANVSGNSSNNSSNSTSGNTSDNSSAAGSRKSTMNRQNLNNPSSADNGSANSSGNNNSVQPGFTDRQSGSAFTDNSSNSRGQQAGISDNNTAAPSSGNNNSASVSNSTQQTVSSSGSIIDTNDLFSDRDLTQSPDLSSAKTITVSDGQTINITEAGTYVIKGTASDCTIRVETDKESKVQLVLDGVTITNSDFPAIYVVSADKCFVTTTSSTNTLSVTGNFKPDGTTNTDAVIFSKDDLVLNGTGTLNINSSSGNGISGKDDIKVTGGTYNITSAEDSIEANDSISVYDGNFTINSSKDGLHSENDDDDTVGWIYIAGGSFNITASSDAIQATTAAQIDGGTFNLSASEGIEATYVQINDGTINISSNDDGINAAQKSRSYSTPTVEINGGNLTIVMAQGDTDAIDANGNIIVNGGTIDITAQMSSFDYDGSAQYNGGTIIINGSQVNSIPQSMMGGRGGMGGMNGGFRGRW